MEASPSQKTWRGREQLCRDRASDHAGLSLPGFWFGATVLIPPLCSVVALPLDADKHFSSRRRGVLVTVQRQHSVTKAPELCLPASKAISARRKVSAAIGHISSASLGAGMQGFSSSLLRHQHLPLGLEKRGRPSSGTWRTVAHTPSFSAGPHIRPSARAAGGRARFKLVLKRRGTVHAAHPNAIPLPGEGSAAQSCFLAHGHKDRVVGKAGWESHTSGCHQAFAARSGPV